MKWIGQHIFDLKSRFRNDVIIDGDLTVSGTYTQIDTDVTTTEQWLVTNDGTGPAAIINQKGSQDIFDVQDDGTSVFYIEDGGKVGIGTTSPSFELDVVGNIGMDNKLYHNGDHNTYIGFESDDIKLRTGGVDVITVNSSQNVGIGTTSPGELLHISSGVATHAKILIDAGADADLILDKGAGSRRSHIDYKIAGTTKWYAGTADSDVVGDGDDYFIGTTVGGTNAEFFLKRSNGNIGIGTTSPLGLLQLDEYTVADQGGNTGHGVASIFADSGDQALYIGVKNASYPNRGWGFRATSVGVNCDFTIKEHGLSGDRLTIKSGGNVGIGTTSPSAKFHINVDSEDNQPALLIEKVSDNNETALVVKHISSSNIRGIADFQNTSGSVMKILADGNVGIGTTSPASLLHVAGTVQVGVDDTGHDVKFFGATSGKYMLWDESADALKFTDSTQLILGTGNDLIIQHASSNSYINSFVGDFYIKQQANDKDIIFQSDDGAGSTATYFSLDGSQAIHDGSATTHLFTIFPDKSRLGFGDDKDLRVYHDSTNSYIANYTGDLLINNYADDKDIIFKSDDGSGGVTAYLTLDGSAGCTKAQKKIRFEDSIIASFGNGDDFYISHNGSYTSLMEQTSDLYISNSADDKDIIFRCDDGSGGLATYLMLDGSIGATIVPDSKSLGFGTGGDMYISHDTTNTHITNFTGDLYITNRADDKDVILRSDDGSGGHTAYLTLDGSAAKVTLQKDLRADDNIKIQAGSSGDVYLLHNGTDSKIENGTGDFIIEQLVDDKDIILKCDDGSGGTTAYLTLDGSATRIYVEQNMQFSDNSQVRLGTGSDFNLYHTGTGSVIQNATGNLTIQQDYNDGDIIFRCDDGSGGTTEYFRLDGGATTAIFKVDTFLNDSGNYIYSDISDNSFKFADNATLKIGTGNDLQLSHDAANSHIVNYAGDLKITQNANDKDIIFNCDDGSGGNTAYLTLDGSAGHTVANKEIQFLDNVVARFGTGNDLSIYHTGTSTLFDNNVGDMMFRQYADDKDIIFQSDDGSGGVTTYFQLDGGEGRTVFKQNALWEDSKAIYMGNGADLRLYHNGSNSFIENHLGNLTIDSAADDADIIFKGTDGGADITALTLDMSAAGKAIFNSSISIPDAGLAFFGTGNDLQINHDGSNSYISNHSGGHLYIQQNLDDRDIVLQCDDGSGGTTAYLTLDGGLGYTTVQKQMKFADSVQLQVGSSSDAWFQHNGTKTQIGNITGDLQIINYADDKDIIFASDDGAGSTATYFSLDGSAATHDGSATTALYTLFPDKSVLGLGSRSEGDMRLYHDGSNSYIYNYTGNLEIINHTDDRDIRLWSDDGSGGVTAYLTLDGSAGYTTVQKQIRFDDSVPAKFGTGNDLHIFHDGTDSLVDNYTGDLYFRQTADDKDIIFQSDDGSGGLATYLKIDGSSSEVQFFANLLVADNIKANFGNSNDLQIYHNGNQSYIDSTGTGNLYLRTKNNSSIYLQDTNGQALAQFSDGGGSHLYYNNSLKISTTNTGVDITGELQADSLDIDGVADISGAVTLGTPLATDQQKHLAWFEIAGFGTGDGTNYEISVNLDNDTAPFSHNVSTGANGTTAITVQNIMRSGGTVMTRAGTIKRWTGWATTAGSSTANVALFKITPARNDNSDVSPVLIDNVSYTAVGNAKMLDFNETSFTDASVAAGDIVVTGIKCEDTKTTYFSSTLEIEF